MKKSLKILKKIILFLIIIILFFLSISFIIHKVKLKHEYKYLKDHGYINLVDAGNYKLNVYNYGNLSGKHKLIGLAGLQVNNYSVEMKYALKDLDKDNLIVFIDRAGYGLSDDTKIDQTVEKVVKDYRTALKNAKIEPPYILMPHSLGGMYATYWESKYPDEIEGVIIIDGSELGIDIWEPEVYKIGFDDWLGMFATNTGLFRYVLHKYFYKLPQNYSKEDQKISDYLDVRTPINHATMSEQKNMNKNTNKTVREIVKNDIPKVYVCASNGFRTVEELRKSFTWWQNRQKEIGRKISKNFTDEEASKILLEYEKWRNENIIPYIDKLGNTKMVFVPGNHMIFEEDPVGLNKVIKEFINNLDN